MSVAPQHLVAELSAEAQRLGWRVTVSVATPMEVRIEFMPEAVQEPTPPVVGTDL